MSNVFPFPCERRVRLIRETVWSLTRKKGAAADRHWRLTINRLTAELQCSGILDPAVIEDELRHFAKEVRHQIHISQEQGIEDRGGAA